MSGRSSLDPKVGFIWDIDGIVVDSPHEEAWRITATKEPWEADDLSSDFYFTHVASRPRYEGGDNILRLKGVYQRLGADTEKKRSEILERFCTQKNALIRELIRKGKFKLYPDALPLLLKSKRMGIPQAASSASKNAKDMLTNISKSRVIEEVGDDFGVMSMEDTLYSLFEVDACGIDATDKGEILKFAAGSLNAIPDKRIEKFVVFEDAPSAIKAAKLLGYYAIGVLRIGEEEALRKAGADIVTLDLRKVKIEDLVNE